MFQFAGKPVADSDQIFQRKRLFFLYKKSKKKFFNDKGTKYRHLYFGKDPFIIDGSAKIRVQPVDQQLFFLHGPLWKMFLKIEQDFGIKGFIRPDAFFKKAEQKPEASWRRRIVSQEKSSFRSMAS